MLFTAFAVSFIGGCVFTLASLSSQKWPGANPAYIATIATLISAGELGSAVFLARAAATNKSPILLQLIARQFRLPPAIQVPWWGWHFIAMTVAPEVIIEEMRRGYGVLPHSIVATVVISRLRLVQAWLLMRACF